MLDGNKNTHHVEIEPGNRRREELVHLFPPRQLMLLRLVWYVAQTRIHNTATTTTAVGVEGDMSTHPHEPIRCRAIGMGCRMRGIRDSTCSSH